MARKKDLQKQLEDGLKQLAFGSVSDAVSLLYLSDEEILAKLPRLKLLNVSEIKRPKGGGMEIKFFDRLKALEKLKEDAPTNREEGLGFYQALEKSVENAGGVFSDND